MVVCTTPYSMLGTYGRDSMLAFEIDHFDYPRSAAGASSSAAAPRPSRTRTSCARSSASLPRPWAAGRRSLYLRIPLTEVTGRRLGDGWDLEETLPVRRSSDLVADHAGCAPG